MGGLFLVALPVLAEPPSGRDSLRAALRLHASFDHELAADFSCGDPVLYQFANRAERLSADRPAVRGETSNIAPDQGRFGGALWRDGKDQTRLFFRSAGVVDSDAKEFSGTVSVWLRTNPDEDLPPAYCDPVMLISDNHRDGFLFIEWSKDHDPRRFRYAIVPAYQRWNPGDLGWEDFPDDERPMVQLKRSPFSRDKWVHVAFTFDRINSGHSASGMLFIDGNPAGSIAGWDLTFEWNPAQVIIAVGWFYAGYIDDLAVFDRMLTADEVRWLAGAGHGVGALYDGSLPEVDEHASRRLLPSAGEPFAVWARDGSRVARSGLFSGKTANH